MPSTNGHNEACCNIPPVVATGYEAKGIYEVLDDMKTYVTGPKSATKGLLSIFDIFGFVDQTIQGADILAHSDIHQNYQVFMPDWFGGDSVPREWFPPDTEEKQKSLGEWFNKHGPQEVAERLSNYIKAVQTANPSIDSWGILGYCWGGKVVELATSSASNPFAIAAVAHPAMLEPAGAEKISVPFIMLASGEEPGEVVHEFKSRLSVPHHVETFEDQNHGWMAARGDLLDNRVRDEYVRGYMTMLAFFRQHWP